MKITKEFCIQELQRLNEKHNGVSISIINKYGKVSVGTLYSKFGSLNNAYAIANVQKPKRNLITKEFCIQELQRLNKEHGKVTSDIIKKHGNISIDTLKSRFGSQNKAYVAAGIELSNGQKVDKPNQTKEFCIQELQRLKQQYGKVTDKILKQYGNVSSDTLKRRFGSLSNAYVAAGFELQQGQRKMTSKEEIVKELYRLHDQFGYVSKPIMEKHSSYSPKIVQRVFGNFENMYKELSFKPAPNGIVLTDEELIAEAKRIYDEQGFLSYDLIEKFSKVSVTAFKYRSQINHWGGIKYYRKMVGCEEPTCGWCESPSAKYAIQKFTHFLNEEPKKELSFDWLYYGRKGNQLRMDAFYANHNLAIEYNGPQHYYVDGFYTKSKAELKRKQEIEKYKIKLLKQHGIKVIVIHFKDKVNEEYVKKALSKVGIKK